LSIIPELSPVTEWGISQYSTKIYDGNFCLVSLMKNRGVVGSKHRDYVDQFQWVVKGEMIWRTGENLENEDHVVEGDFIFVPKNLAHEVETNKGSKGSNKSYFKKLKSTYRVSIGALSLFLFI